ncbi:hypothetical protein QA648_27330 (plasmid) [Rhizobium sp. CB3171]|uniref:hypothetical protein n=1 Tax=Rhizobium sp. CB3171 TaxID=3039157 RepID=UPI0024B24A66|nr:hypothetical protein [Rhizobium sp. CB3171]WFU04497.1 hypothetical protein QA648_27330 [Rhizobium sp. CB3171]
MAIVGIGISLVSLVVSLITLWITQLQRGQIAMTTPTIIFFGFDQVPKTTPKVFLRTLLYSTSARGQIVEGMHAKLRFDGMERMFSFWGYGETDKLTPGSGVYVSKTGMAANHHFVMSVLEDDFEFKPGDYTITIHAHLAHRPDATEIGRFQLALNGDLAAVLHDQEGVLFERQIDGQYQGHARQI